MVGSERTIFAVTAQWGNKFRANQLLAQPIMPRNFVQQAFHAWIKQNRNKFHHAPVQLHYIRDWVEFNFSDVIHEISAVINQHGCNIAFTYHNEVWDFLVCFEVSIERDNDGYYCSQCLAQYGGVVEKHFTTKGELLEAHVFEPLLKWSNERLSRDILAQINQAANGGCTWVKLVSKEKMERKLIAESGILREVFFSDCENELCVMNVIQRRKRNSAEKYYYSLENVASRWLGW